MGDGNILWLDRSDGYTVPAFIKTQNCTLKMDAFLCNV